MSEQWKIKIASEQKSRLINQKSKLKINEK